MALTIRTTGLEQYAPGGSARLKMMVIGGPGAGKTRSASFWPKPIYLDCEAGLASIADRNIPYAAISTSQDMLDALSFLKVETRKRDADRDYQTVIVDTLDAFQRKVKDEWLQANPNAGSFKGYDAWGYLDAKMSMLMTRLLNLDMNIIVNVHYKDKTIKEGVGENATERQELMLQLQGDIKDNAFNDFDLVGWMGSYYEAVDGQRVKKRGVTFTDSPDRPFLKDRLHIAPKWMEITFTEQDYKGLFTALVARLDDMGEGQVVGEIPSEVDSTNTPTRGAVVAPGTSGALPEQDPRDIPLAQFDKPTLTKMARELAIELGEDVSIRGNTIKAEVIILIEELRAKQAARAAAPAVAPKAPVEESVATPATPVEVLEETVAEPATDVQSVDVVEPEPVVVEPEPVAAPIEDLAKALVDTEQGKVDPATGEVVEPVAEPTVAAVASALGGEVISTEQVADAPAPTAPAAGPSQTCADCGKDLAGENPNFVRLSFIKYKRNLCEAHYRAAKKA